MPTYKITIPGQGSFKVTSDTELTDDEAYQYALEQAGSAPKEQPRQGVTQGMSFGEYLRTQPLLEPFTRGAVRGAVVDPINAVRQLLGAEQRRAVSQEEAAYQAQRQEQGEEGFEFGRLIGNVLSPAGLGAAGVASRVAGPTAGIAGRIGAGAASGAAGAALQPVSNASEDVFDFAQEKLGQVGVGAVLGSVLQGGFEGTKGFTKFVQNLAKPLTKSGQDKILREYIDDLAGPDKQRFIDVLNRAEELVPGSRPTAAEALAEIPSSVNIASAQRRIAGDVANAPAFATRAAEQEAARRAAVESVGQTPEVLNLAKIARENDAIRNYGEAFSQTVRANPRLGQIFSNPYIQDALPDAIKLSEAKGINAKTDLTQFINYVKFSLDKQLSKTGEGALSGAEKAAVASAKKELMSWVSSKNPMYKKAREEFAAASVPINQMEIGQELAKKLNSPLDAERAGSFAQAVREAAATIKRSSGEKRFSTLEEALTPKQNAAIQSVLKDLQRSDKAQKLATQSRALGVEANEAQLPQFIDQTSTIFNFLFRGIKKKANDEINRNFAELLLDPQKFAIFMSSVPKSKSKDVVAALYSRLSPDNQALLDNLIMIQAPVKMATQQDEFVE